MALGSLLVIACEEAIPENHDDGTAGLTVNVRGRMVNAAGNPSTGARVMLRTKAGFFVETTLDSSGAFSADRIPTPYDALVFREDLSGNRGVTAVLGLTSASPIVPDLMDSSSTGQLSSGSVKGTVGGGLGFPTPDGYQTSVLFTSPEVRPPAVVLVDNSTGSYTTDGYSFEYEEFFPRIFWSGPTTTVGTVHALQWNNSGGTPTDYAGYGVRTGVALAAGSTLTDQDITLSPVSQVTFSGVYTPPPGYVVGERRVALSFDQASLHISYEWTGTEFSLPTPNIPGATLGMTNVSFSTNGPATSVAFDPGLALDASDVRATSPAAAELALPANGSTGVTRATTFSWTGAPGVMNLLVISPVSSQFAPRYVVITTGTSATLAAILPSDWGLGPGEEYSWVVYGVGPYASIEATSAGIVGDHPTSFEVQGAEFLNSHRSGFVTVSDRWRFTVVPSPWDY